MPPHIKVNVVRLGKGRHRLVFDGDISDTCERGPDGPNGEHTWDMNYPYVSDTMYYVFVDSWVGKQIALDMQVGTRSIEFTRWRDKSLRHTIKRILGLVQKHIGPREFQVIMPPSKR